MPGQSHEAMHLTIVKWFEFFIHGLSLFIFSVFLLKRCILRKYFLQWLYRYICSTEKLAPRTGTETSVEPSVRTTAESELQSTSTDTEATRSGLPCSKKALPVSLIISEKWMWKTILIAFCF